MITSRYLHALPVKGGAKLRLLNLLDNLVLDLDPSLCALTSQGPRLALDNLRPGEIAFLRQRRLLFDDEADQAQALARHIRGLFAPGPELGLTLTLTYFCNLACRYCAQKGLINLRQSMDEATVEATAAWAGEMLRTLEATSLRATFYGGEPLLRPRAMARLARGLAEQCRELEVEPRFDIFTNGYLLGPGMLGLLEGAGIKRLVVTIDGPPAIHDARRPRKDGGPTFGRIVDNLARAARAGFQVCLASNLDAQTPEQIEHLVDILQRAGVAERAEFAFSRTAPSRDNADFFATVPELEARAFSELWAAAQDIVSRHGLRQAQNPARFLTYGFCDYWSPCTFVVMPDGQLTKCLGYLNTPSRVVGDVFTGLRPGGAGQAGFDPADPLAIFAPVCRRCHLLPHCFGGCRYEAELRGLAPRGAPYCQKELIMRGLGLSLENIP